MVDRLHQSSLVGSPAQDSLRLFVFGILEGILNEGLARLSFAELNRSAPGVRSDRSKCSLFFSFAVWRAFWTFERALFVLGPSVFPLKPS